MFDGFSAPEAFGTKGGETRDVEAAVWELPDEQIRLQSNTILIVGHRAGGPRGPGPRPPGRAWAIDTGTVTVTRCFNLKLLVVASG